MEHKYKIKNSLRGNFCIYIYFSSFYYKTDLRRAVLTLTGEAWKKYPIRDALIVLDYWAQ